MATTARVGSVYVLTPSGLLDCARRVSEHTAHDVQVVKPSVGTPGRGQAFVQCLTCSAFVGMVNASSLTKADLKLARGRALKSVYDRFNAAVDANGVDGIDRLVWASVVRQRLAPLGSGRWADAVESFASFIESAPEGKGFWGFTQGSVYFGFNTEGLLIADR